MSKSLKKTIRFSFKIITALIVIFYAPPTNAQINVLNVEITTADKFGAYTNDDVVLELLVSPVNSNGEIENRIYHFENDGDLFERGDTNTFRLTENLPEHQCEIISIRIRKAKVRLEGGWYFGGLLIYYNDDRSLEIYQTAGLEVWLRGSDSDWTPSDYPIPDIDDCPVLPHPPTPENCEVELIRDLPAFYPDSDCDGVADIEDAEPDIPGIDTDSDGIPDAREEIMGTNPNNPDSDGDGIPDAYEDLNRDGFIDAAVGESDPNNPDENSDGVLDGAEDTDGDGWVDGFLNIRTFLILKQIHCENEKEDFGHDEYFLVVDDVRFPEDSTDIDGRFKLEKGDIESPLAIVARRVHSPSQTADYSAVVEMWEDDVSDSDDDYWQTNTVRFGETGETTIDRHVSSVFDNTIYHVTFLAFSRPFRDPHPTNASGGDSDIVDSDGLWDEEEHRLSSELGGLADPSYPDIFLEMDWVGSEQEPRPWSKRDVVSQFYYHDFILHLDDGDFQHLNSNYGGENLSYSGEIFLRNSGGSPSAEQIAITDNHFEANRHGLFHYTIATEEVGGFSYGVSAVPILNDDGNIVCGCSGWRTGLSVFRSHLFHRNFDGEAIFFMHEFGHDFGLCHRPEDVGNTVVASPLCVGLSPTNCPDCSNCSHYWVDQEEKTAMGSWAGFNGFYAVIGAVVSGIVCAIIGLVIGGPIGAGIGFAIGSVSGLFIGGYVGELLARDVMYTSSEWMALNLRAIRCW